MLRGVAVARDRTHRHACVQAKVVEALAKLPAAAKAEAKAVEAFHNLKVLFKAAEVRTAAKCGEVVQTMH